MQFQNTFVMSVNGPLDAAPAHGRIWAGYLKGLTNAVSHLGGDPRKVLEHQDIDPVTFEDPDYDIECGAAVNLIEYCSRSLHDPLFGLHLAEQQGPDAFGCSMALAQAAPTLRDALQSLIEYVPVSTSPECEMELAMAREVAELRWRTHMGLGGSEQMNYQGLLLFMKTLQTLGRQHFRPSYATLTFPIARSDIQLLQNRLGCKVSGKSGANAIAFPVELLDRPIATSNRMLYSLMGSYLSQLRAESKSGLVEQVEDYVRRALPTRNCSVDSCAEKLGTSARTLQKRLTRMGVKFTDIVQTERIELAKHALMRSDCTLDEIAFQLGYSEQTSFGRAFKRSTGVTPQAFRWTEARERAQPMGRSLSSKATTAVRQ